MEAVLQVEHALWGGRLALVCHALKQSASPRALILAGDVLRRALGGLAGGVAPTTVRLSTLAAVLDGAEIIHRAGCT